VTLVNAARSGEITEIRSSIVDIGATSHCGTASSLAVEVGDCCDSQNFVVCSRNKSREIRAVVASRDYIRHPTP
jgi:hypothetical protein